MGGIVSGPVGRHARVVVVAGRENIARDVVLLRLRDPDGRELPSWAPGAHIDVRIPGMLRQYSLCGDSEDRGCYEIAVLHESSGRGGSRFVHQKVSVGTTLQVGRPRNHFRLVEAPGYTFVAGGIGITPIRSMINRCERLGKPWTLFYGGRRRDSMAFFDEFAEYGSRSHLLPQDVHGLLQLDAILADSPPDFPVYCCGPETLIRAIENAGQLADRDIHVERFAPPVPKHQPADRPLTVVCAESQQVVRVAAQVTILDALIASGIDVNYDCRDGTCGTCELEVLEGEPEHRDAILSLAERASTTLMYPCVSRARTERLVLDV